MTARSAAARQRQDRDDQALELRRAGLTFDRIATRLGLANKGSAHKAVQRALERSGGPEMDPDTARVIEADRLDRLQTAIWSKAIRGDLGAVEKVLRISAARCRLLGLDRELLTVAPERSPSSEGGGSVTDESALERLRKERRERQETAGAG